MTALWDGAHFGVPCVLLPAALDRVYAGAREEEGGEEED